MTTPMHTIDPDLRRLSRDAIYRELDAVASQLADLASRRSKLGGRLLAHEVPHGEWKLLDDTIRDLEATARQRQTSLLHRAFSLAPRKLA